MTVTVYAVEDRVPSAVTRNLYPPNHHQTSSLSHQKYLRALFLSDTLHLSGELDRERTK